ncbi:MAG: hypothetical protein ACRD3E_00530 [Terriglobales bacterium]
MKPLFAKKLVLFAILTVGCIFNFWSGWGFDGTEFTGGTITGPILRMSEDAFVLFVGGMIAVWFLPRVASILGLLAGLLSTPLVVYVVAPGPFRHVFRGEYSVPLQSSFYWNGWWLLAGITVVAAMAVSLWNLWSLGRTVSAKQI